MNFLLILFLIGILGFVLNRKNIKTIIIGLIIISLIYIDVILNPNSIIIKYISYIISCLITFTIITFYIDNYTLSKTFLIKFIQIFTFFVILFIPIFISIFIYYNIDLINFIDIIFCIDDNKNGVNLHGHVSIDEKAAKHISRGLSHISQGLNTIGSQIGLGASIVGVSTAVSKGIAKSSMPPLQKAGIIVASGLLTGLGHSVISNTNRKNIWKEENISNIYTNTTNNNCIDSNINKFIDNNTISSPLENLLFDIEALNYICLSLVIILIIQILFKFHFKNNINLNLSYLLGNKINNNLELYLNKIIILNKKMSVIWIWLILILLIIGLSLSGYASSDLYNDLDTYIDMHNSLKNNK